ncbi:beta-defensin 110-like [Cricetulus griseus]|uniref:Beta-defensin 110-like n=1 Tax=Cricetulus griseus TaxID=10029 RepID=A0A9J7J7L1_CRIGR|nr:beta-defensin 110-like [Cricetulus griseus]
MAICACKRRIVRRVRQSLRDCWPADLEKARSNTPPKYRLERCEKVRGMCKTYRDGDEYNYGYCIRWRNQCCKQTASHK